MARNSLVFSRRNDNRVLVSTDIYSRAPSAFATDHAEGLSERYGEVYTPYAIDVLQASGWHPVQAVQRRAYKGEGHHAAHMIAFAHTSDLARTDTSVERPEIILYNSHDGSSSFKLFAGFFRFICSNGMIAGQGFQASMRHTTKSVLSFDSLVRDTVKLIPSMLDTIERMKSVRLDQDQVYDMAREAASLRWANSMEADLSKPGTYYDNQTIQSLIKTYRMQDDLQDSWTVFNRIQENLVRGYATVASITKNKYSEGMLCQYRKARPVTGVPELVRVNRALWDIAGDTAEVSTSPKQLALIEG
jgi:hypothetical protein